jgi:hypothetical protein
MRTRARVGRRVGASSCAIAAAPVETRTVARERRQAWSVVRELIAEYVETTDGFNDHYCRCRRSATWAGSLPLSGGRLPLSGQIPEGVGIEQRLVELASLKVAQFAQRRVAHGLPDAAAQVGAWHRRSVDRAGYWATEAGAERRGSSSRKVPLEVWRRPAGPRRFSPPVASRAGAVRGITGLMQTRSATVPRSPPGFRSGWRCSRSPRSARLAMTISRGHARVFPRAWRASKSI